MNTIEVIGKTVKEALKNALNELNVTEDEVDVEIIEEGSKGLFNFIGARPAKIKVTKKKTSQDEVELFLDSTLNLENELDNISNSESDAKLFLENVLSSMGIKADIETREEKDTIFINVTGPKMGLVIGYRGETLDALQYLTSLVVNKNHDNPYRRIVLDTENYREKREETLKRVAQKTAYKVKKSGRPFKLEPMNPYERRVVHSALQDYKDINTYSEGEEPFRRIVVTLKK